MGLLEAAISGLGIVLTIVNGWLVFVLRGLQVEMRDLRSAHAATAQKLSDHEIMVAGKMISRAEFKTDMRDQTVTMQAMFTKLENKLSERNQR